MARIRSVHPGLFTDEAFAVLSCDAQMFFIGIWTEADDQGVFEWKPMTLRMRLRPSKDGDVSPLLAELEDANSVKRFELDGKSYGAVRNFRKWQRPEKPKARLPLPEELRSYVGLSPTDHQPVTDHSPKVSAEGGGRRKEEDEGGKDSPLSDAPDEVVAAVEAWNDLAEDVGLSRVQVVSVSRRKKTTARLSEIGGLPGWDSLLAIIRQSPHLLGKTPPKDGEGPWACDFDWLIEPRNTIKVMEGKYLRRTAHEGKTNGSRNPSPSDTIAKIRSRLDEAETSLDAQGH